MESLLFDCSLNEDSSTDDAVQDPNYLSMNHMLINYAQLVDIH